MTSSAEDGPDVPDCPSRATRDQARCAQRGCGFCLAAESELDRRLVEIEDRAFICSGRTGADGDEYLDLCEEVYELLGEIRRLRN